MFLEQKIPLDITNYYKSTIRDNNIIYTHLAHALARNYTDLYYVNMDSAEYIEYHTDKDLGLLTEVRRGDDFFESCKREARLYIHADDQEKFTRAMDRDFLSKVLQGPKEFEMTYRRIKNGRTFYVLMKVSRMADDTCVIVIAVADIDELMRQRQAEERIKEERIIYARLHALSGNVISIYVVDPETDHYRKISAEESYTQGFSTEIEGTDFFGKALEFGHLYVNPKDRRHFLSSFTKENVMTRLDHSSCFTLTYRFMVKGKSIYVQLKAAMVEEEEGPRLIVGIYDIDEQVKQEKEYGRRLEKAETRASVDALTGVKNKHAYLATEVIMDHQIADQFQQPFALVIFDVNDLKKVNDTAGHQAGDQYLRDTCEIICTIFKHSPVFRVGGDEFAVVVEGKDYTRLEELLDEVNRHNEEAIRNGGVVIACGMARYENDECVAEVFGRADHNMYENKNELKERDL